MAAYSHQEVWKGNGEELANSEQTGSGWIHTSEELEWITEREELRLKTGINKKRKHSGKHAEHLIKQQRFDDSHVHLCSTKNVCLWQMHTQTHTTCVCVSPYFCRSGIITDRIREKRENGE